MPSGLSQNTLGAGHVCPALFDGNGVTQRHGRGLGNAGFVLMRSGKKGGAWGRKKRRVSGSAPCSAMGKGTLNADSARWWSLKP